MPVTYDFNNGGSPVGATGPNLSISNTAGGVTFTLSGDAAGGAENIAFGNSAVAIPLFMGTNNDGNDVFTLTFRSTANTANNILTGNATNPVQFSVQSLVGSWRVSVQTVSGSTFTAGLITTGGTFVLGTTSITGIVFTALSGQTETLLLNSLSANELNCFIAGTAIATPEGPRAVEEISEGDMVLTADGRTVPVNWLGVQRVDTRLVHPDVVNPICITAGALGGGLPERDLRVSQDHAVAIDGYLINAGALVNGTTIYQEIDMPKDGFAYYHIETDAHELLLAEGVAAESFIDYAGRDAFENGDESCAQITEMDLPRISSARLVPEHIRAALAPAIAAQ